VERKKASDFPQEVLNLFDGYVHGAMSRREFLDRAAKYAIGGFTAAAMLESLRPNFAWAQQVARDDGRIKAEYLSYPSPRGSDTTRGYLVRPAKAGGRLAGVLVIHENRGLNPYIEDVARRLAVEGYATFAPDALAPAGGCPGDEDQARAMFAQLDGNERTEDLVAAAGFLKFHYAEHDERINAGWPAYEEALKANGVRHQMHMYQGTNHGLPQRHDATVRRSCRQAGVVAHARVFPGTPEGLRALERWCPDGTDPRRGGLLQVLGFCVRRGLARAPPADEHYAIVTYWRSFEEHDKSHADKAFSSRFEELAKMCSETKELGYDKTTARQSALSQLLCGSGSSTFDQRAEARPDRSSSIRQAGRRARRSGGRCSRGCLPRGCGARPRSARMGRAGR